MINDFLNYENIKIYLNYEQVLKNIVERTSCDEISNITLIYKTLTFQWVKLKTYRNILCIINITYEVSLTEISNKYLQNLQFYFLCE